MDAIDINITVTDLNDIDWTLPTDDEIFAQLRADGFDID